MHFAQGLAAVWRYSRCCGVYKDVLSKLSVPEAEKNRSFCFGQPV